VYVNFHRQEVLQKQYSFFTLWFAEIERDLISERTKQGLAVAREKGRMLGRPKGRGRSKLDKHKEEIMQLLKNESTKVHISMRFNCSYAALYVWLQHEELLNHGKNRTT